MDINKFKIFKKYMHIALYNTTLQQYMVFSNEFLGTLRICISFQWIRC
jgi:hypothetical protein